MIWGSLAGSKLPGKWVALLRARPRWQRQDELAHRSAPTRYFGDVDRGPAGVASDKAPLSEREVPIDEAAFKKFASQTFSELQEEVRLFGHYLIQEPLAYLWDRDG